jgi:hypothetical protein
MKTWRERIAEARERGKFTDEDRQDAYHPCTCGVGEMETRFGLEDDPRVNAVFYRNTNKQWEGLAFRFPEAIAVDDFDEADRLLDAIEDRALALKREQA